MIKKVPKTKITTVCDMCGRERQDRSLVERLFGTFGWVRWHDSQLGNVWTRVQYGFTCFTFDHYDKHICGYCFETTLRDFIESQKKNIKPTV